MLTTAARHGKETIKRVHVARGDAVVGYYVTDKRAMSVWDVVAGDTCMWYPDDSVERWFKRMEAEYGDRRTW